MNWHLLNGGITVFSLAKKSDLEKGCQRKVPPFVEQENTISALWCSIVRHWQEGIKDEDQGCEQPLVTIPKKNSIQNTAKIQQKPEVMSHPGPQPESAPQAGICPPLPKTGTHTSLTRVLRKPEVSFKGFSGGSVGFPNAPGCHMTLYYLVPRNPLALTLGKPLQGWTENIAEIFNYLICDQFLLIDICLFRDSYKECWPSWIDQWVHSYPHELVSKYIWI